MSKKKKRAKNKRYVYRGTVTAEPIVWIIGMICSLVFGILFVVYLKQEEDIAGLLVFGFFLLLGLYLLMMKNWRIDFDTKGFTYRNIFRISRHYDYSEITRIHLDKDSRIWIGRKSIPVDQMTIGRENFLFIAMQHTPKVRQTTARDNKLFNGHIRNPEEFVFIYFMLGSSLLVLFLMLGISNPPLKLDNLHQETVLFSDCQELYTESDTPYLKLIPENQDDYFMLYEPDDYHVDIHALQKEIYQQTEFIVYYQIKTDEDKSRQVVYQLETENQIYLSVNTVNEERLSVYLIFVGILLLWIVFGMISNHIMSHADRYPRAVRLLVKEDYLIK